MISKYTFIMPTSAFSIGRLPKILFGAGEINALPDLIGGYGRRLLLVTGHSSFIDGRHWPPLAAALEKSDIRYTLEKIGTEPSPEIVDEIVARHADDDIDVVLAIGGGSVVDAGKAIAGLLRVQQPVTDFLEGVGPELSWPGPAVPFIAVPTTAGTGSEATRNAVLSRQGADGFKKSFRHEDLVPAHALIDPELLADCPPALIAANGMDALTQLLESFVSLKANPFSDALAIDGLQRVRDSLLPWYRGEGDVATARANMAWAALLSGITLAHVGLGSVHGLASPLGAFFPIPHGVVCGTLLATATAVNIRALQEREPQNPALARYARLGELFCNKHFANASAARQALVELLTDWTTTLALPRLSTSGVTAQDLPRIIAACRGSSMQTNPIVLTDAEAREILQERL